MVNDIYYYEETPDEVIKILEHARRIGLRIRLYYGDPATGRDWEEIHDIEGYVGVSTGQLKTPILLYNKNTTVPGSLMSDLVVKIKCANRKDGDVLWQHPNYNRF